MRGDGSDLVSTASSSSPLIVRLLFQVTWFESALLFRIPLHILNRLDPVFVVFFFLFFKVDSSFTTGPDDFEFFVMASCFVLLRLSGHSRSVPIVLEKGEPRRK